MIVTLELTADTRQRITADAARADAMHGALVEALAGACAAGAEGVREMLVMGELGLTMRNPGQGGLAEGVQGWLIDEGELLGAVGVPSDHPSFPYAWKQEYGGTIYPRGRALAIPLTDEARQWSGPREMESAGGIDLVFIDRSEQGKPPLLIQDMGNGEIIVHWVLVPSVTLVGHYWLRRGTFAQAARMADVFADVFWQHWEQQ